MPRLAEKLASKMPPGLDVTYFVNSGSEANDLAITMARLFTGHTDVIALRNGYHGGSPSAMGLTSHHTWKLPTLQGAYVHHALCPEPYRTPLGGTPEEVAAASAADIGELIRNSTPGRIAAFIAEPIQGVGGVTSGGPNYFREAYRIAREHGGLCIADEVQTGFGRTGRMFAMEHFGVEPDLMTIAKSIAAGLPLSGVIGRAEIMDGPHAGAIGGTYIGNPVAQAAALAVLDVFEEESVLERAGVLGDKIRARMHAWQERWPAIGDVRGLGAMLAIDLVRDPGTKEPAPELAAAVIDAALERGLILLKAGSSGNCIRVLCPLTIEEPVLDEALTAWEEALSAVLG
jgi:4-aminobutyrate aminotransferase/(S)-3-amino-2-methylpropionate transaminase